MPTKALQYSEFGGPAVLPLIESGRVGLPVEATFPIADAASAYRRVETGHRQGKIVIAV